MVGNFTGYQLELLPKRFLPVCDNFNWYSSYKGAQSGPIN